MNSYVEEDLQRLTHTELLSIIEQWAALYKCEVGRLIPVGASRDLMIDMILECQEEKGGAE